MADTTGPITLPNPYTPMAFVQPDLATAYTNERYAAAGSLAVLLWDILLHLHQDYKLVTRYRLNFLFVTYCIARVASVGYLFGVVIMTTAPVDNCHIIRYIGILYPIAIPLGILPFMMRVFALYRNNKFVIAFFSITWLSVVGGCVAMPIGSVGRNFGTTKHCYQSLTGLTNALTSFSPFIHDSLIFLATSWGLMRNSYSGLCIRSIFRVVVLGKELPVFSKSILRDGQAYYLAALLLNIFFVVLSYMTRPAITPCTIGIPHFAILSNMSSYVYRNMRLGFYRDYSESITTSAINRALQGPGQADQQHYAMVFRNPAASPRNSEVANAQGEISEHVRTNLKPEGDTGNLARNLDV